MAVACPEFRALFNSLVDEHRNNIKAGSGSGSGSDSGRGVNISESIAEYKAWVEDSERADLAIENGNEIPPVPTCTVFPPWLSTHELVEGELRPHKDVARKHKMRYITDDEYPEGACPFCGALTHSADLFIKMVTAACDAPTTQSKSMEVDPLPNAHPSQMFYQGNNQSRMSGLTSEFKELNVRPL